VTRGATPESLSYTYTLNGEEQTFDAEARHWFEQALDEAVLEPFRRSQAAGQAIPLDGVFFHRLHDQFTSFVKANWGQGAVKPVTEILVISLPDTYGPEQRQMNIRSHLARAAHARAHSLATDAELIRFLQDVLQNQQPEEAALQELFITAREITSDSLKTQLLLNALENIPLTSDALYPTKLMGKARRVDNDRIRHACTAS
jgi:hypothetical protein